MIARIMYVMVLNFCFIINAGEKKKQNPLDTHSGAHAQTSSGSAVSERSGTPTRRFPNMPAPRLESPSPSRGRAQTVTLPGDLPVEPEDKAKIEKRRNRRSLSPHEQPASEFLRQISSSGRGEEIQQAANKLGIGASSSGSPTITASSSLGNPLSLSTGALPLRIEQRRYRLSLPTDAVIVPTNPEKNQGLRGSGLHRPDLVKIQMPNQGEIIDSPSRKLRYLDLTRPGESLPEVNFKRRSGARQGINFLTAAHKALEQSRTSSDGEATLLIAILNYAAAYVALGYPDAGLATALAHFKTNDSFGSSSNKGLSEIDEDARGYQPGVASTAQSDSSHGRLRNILHGTASSMKSLFKSKSAVPDSTQSSPQAFEQLTPEDSKQLRNFYFTYLQRLIAQITAMKDTQLSARRPPAKSGDKEKLQAIKFDIEQLSDDEKRMYRKLAQELKAGIYPLTTLANKIVKKNLSFSDFNSIEEMWRDTASILVEADGRMTPKTIGIVRQGLDLIDRAKAEKHATGERPYEPSSISGPLMRLLREQAKAYPELQEDDES